MTSISLPGASGSCFVRSVFTCWVIFLFVCFFFLLCVLQLSHLRDELDLNQLCWQRQSRRYDNRTCHFGPLRPVRFLPNWPSSGKGCVHVCDVEDLLHNVI